MFQIQIHHPMADIDQIINGDIDLYQYLNLPPDASSSHIRKQYRQKALLYHPDKNPTPEAASNFHLLSIIYEILTTNELRSTYDKIQTYKQQKSKQSQELDEQTKWFKERLINAETRAKRPQSFNELTKEQELETLKDEGLKRRKQLEQSKYDIKDSKEIYKSYKDIPITQYVDLAQESIETNKVIVKWKHRPELKDMFSLDILADIMTVFGPVVKVEPMPNSEDKYKAAIVEFQTYENVDRAINHNYKKSASLWDGTSHRKLASLLRECKKIDHHDHQVTNDDLKAIKEFQVQNGLTDDLLTDNKAINNLICSLVHKELGH